MRSTKTEILIKILKKRWLSNFKACELIKSASADRLIRFIRENPPKDYEFIERTKHSKIDGLTIVFKEFRLKQRVE